MKFNVVVTGASKGIGFAVAKRFAKEGHHLFLVARNADHLHTAKLNLLGEGASSVDVFAADLSVRSEVSLAINAINEVFTHVNVLVNNAGLFLPGTMMEENEGQFEHLLQTNLTSAYHVTRGLWDRMKGVERAHVFNMCSIASITAYAAGGSYSVVKFGLLGFSKSLRLEGVPHGIRVSSVLPGATLTDSWAGVDLPESRFMRADDVAETIFTAFEINDRTVMEEIVLRPLLGDL